MKYGKPIWQLVAEAADNIGKEVITASDIIQEIHKTNPKVPKGTIGTFVIAMAPNHSTSHHYKSTSKNHPYFYYLGNGKFRLLKSNDKPLAKVAKNNNATQPCQVKQVFLQDNFEVIVSWITKHQIELINGRNNYGWNGKLPIEAVHERNEISKRVILSRIRNGGGLDIDTINQVMAWGGLRQIKLENAEALEITRNAFALLDKGELKEAALKLMSINGVGIASASKIIGLFDQNTLAIYDSRVGTALRSLVIEGQRLVKCPPGRTRPGDLCSDRQWAENYERLIWILEVIRDHLNKASYPFSIADVEMALFMMGK